jgi:predicted GH43/DUF377 family glycosyl hydrolase
MRNPKAVKSLAMSVETCEALGLRDREWRRQDPSNILRIRGVYRVWYARHPAAVEWNETRTKINGMEIWSAFSKDGRRWTEEGRVLPPSKPGAWHERAVHAPHVVPWQGRYYLFFTAFHGVYSTRKRTGRKCIGLAVAPGPEGPFEHVGNRPIMAPSDDPAAFDYFLVDDPCVIRRQGEFWLYYKGRNSDTSECRLGVAVAHEIAGPYERLQDKPVCEADWHTACVWPRHSGVAGIIDGTAFAYSETGWRFTLGDRVPKEIIDPGVFCPEAFSEKKKHGEVTWGLALGWGPEHLFRFDMVSVLPRREDHRDTTRNGEHHG